jgi:hypothetical protein
VTTNEPAGPISSTAKVEDIPAPLSTPMMSTTAKVVVFTFSFHVIWSQPMPVTETDTPHLAG